MGRNGSGKSSLLWAMQGSGPRLMGRVDAPRAASASCLNLPRTCSTSRPSRPSARRPTVTRARRRARRRDARSAGGGHRRPTPTPATSPKGSGWHWSSRCSSPAAPERAAARRADPRPRPDRQGAVHRRSSKTSPPPATPSSSRRTTSSSSPTCADRVVVLADGEVVADGPTADIVCSSPAFAPQVAKILQPSTMADGATRSSRRSHEDASAAMTTVVQLRTRSTTALAARLDCRPHDVRLAVPRHASERARSRPRRALPLRRPVSPA